MIAPDSSPPAFLLEIGVNIRHAASLVLLVIGCGAAVSVSARGFSGSDDPPQDAAQNAAQSIAQEVQQASQSIAGPAMPIQDTPVSAPETNEDVDVQHAADTTQTRQGSTWGSSNTTSSSTETRHSSSSERSSVVDLIVSDDDRDDDRHDDHGHHHGRPAPDNEDLVGNWTLGQENGASCTVRLEDREWFGGYSAWVPAGCPDDFFSANRWLMSGRQLLITDSQNNVKGRFWQAGNGPWSGQRESDGARLYLNR